MAGHAARRRARRALALAALACGCLLPGAAARPAAPAPGLPQYVPAGRLVADLGYRPRPDGFSFPNYAGSLNELTPQTMQRLFGQAVCRTGSGPTCLLHPPAQAWLEQTNSLMRGGLCMGFSVDSLLFFRGKVLQARSYGADTAFALHRTPRLEGALAYGWTFQLLDPVVNAEVDASPAAVVSALVAALKSHGELYTLAVFQPNFLGGHAVTPFAVERRPDGGVAILVYDNNWPGETRAVLVDPVRNTWTYAASAFPDRPTEVYRGGAATKTLVLLPTSPGLAPQPCPFCRPASRTTSAVVTAARRYDRLALTGDPRNHPSVLITDRRGRRLGLVAGRLVNEIPGARVLRRLLDHPGWADRAEPEYVVPAGVDLRVTLDAAGLRRPSLSRFSLIGRGDDVVVDRIALAPGQRATLRIRAGAASLAYGATAARTAPLLRLGVEGTAVDRAFSVGARSLRRGSTLTVSLDQAHGRFRIQAGGTGAAGTVDVSLERLDARGARTFVRRGLEVGAGQTATLDYTGWQQPGDPLPITVADSSLVAVPDVTGQDEATATGNLEDAGFTVQVDDRETADPAEAGTVLDQTPPAGSDAPQGSTVTIVVGRAAALGTVPDVVGRDEATATATLQQAGFVVATADRPTSDPAEVGVVLDQEPAAGSRAPAGDTVTIGVGRQAGG